MMPHYMYYGAWSNFNLAFCGWCTAFQVLSHVLVAFNRYTAIVLPHRHTLVSTLSLRFSLEWLCLDLETQERSVHAAGHFVRCLRQHCPSCHRQSCGRGGLGWSTHFQRHCVDADCKFLRVVIGQVWFSASCSGMVTTFSLVRSRVVHRADVGLHVSLLCTRNAHPRRLPTVHYAESHPLPRRLPTARFVLAVWHLISTHAQIPTEVHVRPPCRNNPFSVRAVPIRGAVLPHNVLLVHDARADGLGAGLQQIVPVPG